MHAKVIAALMNGFGPEFTFQLALGQSARRSVAVFRKSGYLDWTIRHAFLADMGGFTLHTSDWVAFPLNAKQLHYLVTHGFVSYADVGLPNDIIADKNKADRGGQNYHDMSDTLVLRQLLRPSCTEPCDYIHGAFCPFLHHVYRWYLDFMGTETNGRRMCH